MQKWKINQYIDRIHLFHITLANILKFVWTRSLQLFLLPYCDVPPRETEHWMRKIEGVIKDVIPCHQGIALKQLLKMYFMLAILSKNKARFTYSDHAHLFSEFNMLTNVVWWKTGLEAILHLKNEMRSAGTEVTSKQRDKYKQADSLEKSMEIPHYHRSGSLFKLEEWTARTGSWTAATGCSVWHDWHLLAPVELL